MPDDEHCDAIRRFADSDEGKQFLDGIRAFLAGRTIEAVDFVNSGEGITTVLRLDNAECYGFNDEELFLETLREQFSGLFRELEHHHMSGS